MSIQEKEKIFSEYDLKSWELSVKDIPYCKWCEGYHLLHIETCQDYWKRISLQLQKQISTLYDVIKHGDEEHQKWLKEAIDKHFSKKENK